MQANRLDMKLYWEEATEVGQVLPSDKQCPNTSHQTARQGFVVRLLDNTAGTNRPTSAWNITV